MVGTGQPCADTLDAESEAAVGNSSVTADVDVELVRLARSALLVDALEDLLLGPGALTAAEDLAIALGSEQVVA